MAQNPEILRVLLAGLEGVQDAYFQPPTKMVYPSIVISRTSSDVTFADNRPFSFKKGYDVIVMDRDPLSGIPDQVEALPLSRLDRTYKANGLYHFVYRIFF